MVKRATRAKQADLHGKLCAACAACGELLEIPVRLLPILPGETILCDPPCTPEERTSP